MVWGGFWVLFGCFWVDCEGLKRSQILSPKLKAERKISGKKRTKRYPHSGAPSPKARGQHTNGTPTTRKKQKSQIKIY